VELKENESYELIDGQRRFLAHKELEKENPIYSKIYAVVYANVMEDWEKRIISVNANITQQPMRDGDKTNAITSLYNHFGGNVAEVSRQTGLSPSTIKRHVNYVRLPEPLKKMVDDKKVNIKVAIKTADMFDGVDVDDSKICQTASMLAKLQNPQIIKVAERVKRDPNEPVSEIVQKVRNQKQKEHHITVKVYSDTYEKISKFKTMNQKHTIEGAAEDLIDDGIEANRL